MLLKLRWRGLRTRIIGWSFFPTAMILLAVALVTLYAYQQVTEDLVIGRNRELTRLSASQVAAGLREHTDLLEAVSRTSDLQDEDVNVRRAALRGAGNRLSVFDAGAVVLDTQGVVVATEPERPEILGKDWSDRGYFRQMLRAPGPVFSDIVADGPRGAETIVVAVPIAGRQGEFQGALAGMFRVGATTVSTFYGGIVKLRLGETDGTYIVDSNGRLIYHSDPERIGDDVSVQPAVQQVLSRKVGDTRTHGISGEEAVASYAPVPDTPWGLVVEESWSTLMSLSRGYQTFLLILVALGLIVPAIVVTFAARRITDPVTELISAAKEVAGGSFGRTIAVSTGDELEELARQFNIMSQQLQESYAQLEQRVAARTRELEVLNAIAAVASRSLDLDEIMHDALDKTLEVTNTDAGWAYALEDEGCQVLALLAHRGLSDEFVKTASRLSSPVDQRGLAVAADRPLVRQVGDYPDGNLKNALVREGLHLVVSVPLTAKGQTLGVIGLGTRLQRSFSPEELSLLAATGQQIGVALENARLYQQAEESAAAAERSRLARDLHDAVSQTLFSASLIAEVLPRLWERDPDEGRRRLEELRQLTRGALAEMRTLLLELRPTALVEASLSDLLRQLAEAITGRARVPVEVRVEGRADLPQEARVGLYRIAQEALNNVAKHSGAKRAKVELVCEEGRVELRVSDDGRGFEVGSVSSDHLGLGIMRERAEAIGAELRINSRPGQGTEIKAVWQNEKERHRANS